MDVSDHNSIFINYQKVLEDIQQAARIANRDPATIQLVVVTKGHPLDGVNAAIEAGLKIFGENYVEEAIAKIDAQSAHADLQWHMIGHVQSRKARTVAKYFDWVHSLDSTKLAKRLDRFAREENRKLPILLECNVSGEGSKFGWIAWQEDHWNTLYEKIAPILELPNLEVRGLMTMAPFLADPEGARPYFQRLRRLQESLASQFPQAKWDELSMGMSADFKIAIQEGATMVRIGTAIMGLR